MPDAVDLKFAIGLPPEKAIAYFENKGYAIGFNWRDIEKEAHAKAFTVAGVMKIDVLQDIRTELDKALKTGGTLAEFKDNLKPLLERKGYFGRGLIVDHDTGEIQGKRLTPRRLNNIFQTNMQSAYQAGRYATQLEDADIRPYWEYVAIMDSRTRPAHARLNGRIFHFDDAFWASFYPPNGWRCRCRVRTYRARDMDQRGLASSSSDGQLVTVLQPAGAKGQTVPAMAYKDPATGKTFTADVGFDYNPGRAWMRPFTPPPSNSLPQTFPKGMELPALPKPLQVNAKDLLPAGLNDQEYARHFLKEFDADIARPQLFQDVTGTRLPINQGLFQDGKGEWKSNKNGRGEYLTLLADTLKHPDEVWLRWEQSRSQEGAWLLKRRYIKAYAMEEQDKQFFGLGVFEWDQEGWSGSTIFAPKPNLPAAEQLAYIAKQRDGMLAWRTAAQ